WSGGPRQGHLRWRADVDPFGKPHEVLNGTNSELVHHPGAMHFDGLFDRAKLCGNLLVEPAGDYVPEDLALTYRQPGKSRLDIRPFAADLARLEIPFPGAIDGGEKVAVTDRLGQEIDGAILHRPHARENVALAGQEDDLPAGPFTGKRFLQL